MFTSDELNQIKIFACLDETERIRYAEKAADVRLCAGDWLIREGEPPWFFVLFEGRLRMAKDVLGRQEDLNQHYEYKIGDFFGETAILLGTQALVSLRAETPCRVARFDRQQFQNLIRDSKEASAMILQTMNDRLIASAEICERRFRLPACSSWALNTTSTAGISAPFSRPTGFRMSGWIANASQNAFPPVCPRIPAARQW